MKCQSCDHEHYLPHFCGNRNCPHCQAHESQQWIEKQQAKLVPGQYYLLTFTLPAEFREVAYAHQRIVYASLFRCAWETIQQFSQNDKILQGMPSATVVLHTHSRRLDYHPHVHLLMPATAINTSTNELNKKTGDFLFSQKALAVVFRAKMLETLTASGIDLPARHPKKWIVHCKKVGNGKKTIVYLGRYLYRGVIQEKNIVACENGNVTFRYEDSTTKIMKTRTVSGVEFIRMLLMHVLPKGFRRARNFGFLHSNSKWLSVVQLVLKIVSTVVAQIKPAIKCSHCGGVMKIVETRIPALKRTIQSCVAMESVIM